MKRNWIAVFIGISVFSGSGFGQQSIATLEVRLAAPPAGIAVPVRLELDGITSLPDSALTLVQVINTERISVLFQIRSGMPRTLHWLIDGAQDQSSFIFELLSAQPGSKPAELKARAKDGLLTIGTKDRNLLGYQYETMYPPAGVDSSYKRSGFIHPLWAPHGQVLTRVQPPDHYHHYGLWNPWTRVLFEGDTLDFWNLKQGQGTVRFAKFVSKTDGPVFSEFQVLHEHVVLKNGANKVALNELQTVRVYQPNSKDYYILDFTSELNCATESPFKILAYRYQGLGWRATEKWHKGNSEILTSQGKTRLDADHSTARWCIVQGELDDDYGGAIMLSNPANYGHPEPLRIWPIDVNDRGDVYANFVPTRNVDWLLLPGQRYVLKYRFVVFNGKMGKEEAENSWRQYDKPPQVAVKPH